MKLAHTIVISLFYFTCMIPITVIAGRAPPPFFSCTDYHCDEGETVTLSEEQWRQVVALFPPTEIPAEDRELLERKEINGLSLKELRKLYNANENALKVRLFRARKRALAAHNELTSAVAA